MGTQQSKKNSNGRSSDRSSKASVDASNQNKCPNFGRTYHDIKSSVYILPSDDREIDRLILHHYCIKLGFNGNLIAPVEDILNEGGRVLDIGCGPGIWALEIAHDFEVFHGIDLVPMFPQQIKPPNVEFAISNVLERLPFPDNYFDFVQMRSFVVALRTYEWPVAIQEIFRVVKPGGWAQLIDIDQKFFRLDGESKAFFDEMTVIITQAGLDPFIAKHLGKHLKKAGFEDVQSTRISIPIGPWKGQLGQMMSDDMCEGFIGASRLYCPAMNLTAEEYEVLIRKMFHDANKCESYYNWYGHHGRKPIDQDSM
ncbi:S-adenosyl-L-methionine-dependent methyltransferase [Jimgerdemannia flammicorona]|uniref:S-adenosyl-L-methionine-dependent methyltransferase n=1 Tax=Jimgerdemannia flammicorona TaxID=994334 RepID=A0A433QL33_9FUNG|nr:S-adenosyl-L-methionine-dependent methyltransferase [Jimgerdemannia flammicorona]